MHARRLRVGIGMLLMAMIFAAPVAFAAEKLPEGTELVVTGKNYCVACALNAKGAKVSEPEGQHHYALKVTDVRDPDGRYVPGMIGFTLYYLPNDAAKPLLNGDTYQDKLVTIKGRVFGEERAIEVLEVSAAKEQDPTADLDSSVVGTVSGQNSGLDDSVQ